LEMAQQLNVEGIPDGEEFIQQAQMELENG
jgi:hypothetical protein